MIKEKNKQNKIIFILGGARSGKSTYAQQLAASISDNVLFIATAEALDNEMKARIIQHRKSRPVKWVTMEIAKDIAGELTLKKYESNMVIIDCVTMLVSNLMKNYTSTSKIERQVTTEINNLIKFIKSQSARFIIVSNEVGMGLVPDNKLARDYRDILGKVNQIIAQNADNIYFMLGGIPLKIK